jgi:hypothetical protein
VRLPDYEETCAAPATRGVKNASKAATINRAGTSPNKWPCSEGIRKACTVKPRCPAVLADYPVAVLSLTNCVPIWTAFARVLSHAVPMRMRGMSPELFNSVPCPTCRVGPGKRCLLHSGGLRNEPHVDRKLAAIEGGKMRFSWPSKPLTAVKMGLSSSVSSALFTSAKNRHLYESS